MFFIHILGKLLPFFFIIFLGYLAGKYLAVQRQSVASLVIYILGPFAFFAIFLQRRITGIDLLLPVLAYLFACLFALVRYFVAPNIKSPEKNILAYMAGTGNNGYFGIPVTLSLLGLTASTYAALLSIGFTLYEITLGVFLLANGKFTLKESLTRAAKIPTFYAFVLAVILSMNRIGIPGGLQAFFTGIINSFSLLGIMLIGIALGHLTEWRADWRLIIRAFVVRFLVWPLVMLGLVTLDSHFFLLFNTTAHQVFLLMGCVPLASSSVAFATEFDIEPEKVAITVAASSLFATFYIPVIFTLITK